MAAKQSEELATTARVPVVNLPVPYEAGSAVPALPGGEDPEAILAEPPDTRDISAELAEPPRRKLPLLSMLLFAGMIAGLGFAGGAYYEKQNPSSTSTAGAGFARTGAAPGGFSAEGGAGGGFGGGAPGGTGGTGTGSSTSSTSGTVKLVDGSTVYLTTSSGSVIKVTTKSSTKVTTTKTGKTTDLTPGQTVTVEGTTDSSGSVAATTVTEAAPTTSG
ncbi:MULTISPECIES: hypothetical protein [Streptacidiphilus]|uniref:DUF5666 domain-containing protein n=1 Tax=Streptacidiphilus cavernicola TaxID=3342716 RepID=A0ABV6UNQ4_9ACTN|nr:hypothetical protein [Streptacidiphilus jeojiense]